MTGQAGSGPGSLRAELIVVAEEIEALERGLSAPVKGEGDARLKAVVTGLIIVAWCAAILRRYRHRRRRRLRPPAACLLAAPPLASVLLTSGNFFSCSLFRYVSNVAMTLSNKVCEWLGMVVQGQCADVNRLLSHGTSHQQLWPVSSWQVVLSVYDFRCENSEQFSAAGHA